MYAPEVVCTSTGRRDPHRVRVQVGERRLLSTQPLGTREPGFVPADIPLPPRRLETNRPQELMVYRTILAPLDGSEFAEHALTTAAHLAATAKAPLLLARVHQSPSHLGPTWDDFFRNEERGYLERVAARVAQTQRIDVETALLDGDVVDAIRECAEQRAECLIVMTTNGRTGISRAWFGSVADGIVRNGTRPVLMLRPQGPARPSMTPTIGLSE